MSLESSFFENSSIQQSSSDEYSEEKIKQLEN